MNAFEQFVEMIRNSPPPPLMAAHPDQFPELYEEAVRLNDICDFDGWWHLRIVCGETTVLFPIAECEEKA